MNDFKNMPDLMKAQAEEGKTDKYLEITETMLAVNFDALKDEDKNAYAAALKQVLDLMDFQIYEHYRALADRFVKIVRENYSSLENVEKLVEWGIQKHFLLGEWFEEDDCVHIDIEGKERLQLKVLFVSARSMSFEIAGAGKYETNQPFEVYINGKKTESQNTVVQSVFGLIPSRKYELTVVSADGSQAGQVSFDTKYESVTLRARDFGAVGDGETDDTACLQAAILNCPADGRVLVDAGVYRFSSLFLKSNIYLEIAENAVLRALPVRAGHGMLPAMLPSTDGNAEFNFGTWEGNPLPMYTGILSGVEVENVCIYGRGVLDGCASKADWWDKPKQMNGAYRPRLYFLNSCKKVVMQGLTLKNSPSWTIHPYFSEDLGFYNVSVLNPFDSPNTDGLDPESCRGVEIAGVRFSLGDDCIAVKSGKIYMGRKHQKPSESIRIHNCLMENGHGAVTIGSEMAGGVKNLTVEDCVFSHTDRGLRIKTRRGRGRDAVLDRIIFRNIKMDHVMTPFVVNSFYFCDPDGKTEYVQSREVFHVDERTPLIKRLEFENIDATNCHVAAAYIEGLPEQKIEELIMRRVNVTYAENPKCDVPAMSEGVEACSLKGAFIRNVKQVTLDRVNISGNTGEPVVTEGVDEMSLVSC